MNPQMIIVPNMESRQRLIEALAECAAEPWLGNINWSEAGKALGISPNAARMRYRRLEEELEVQGYTVNEFALQVLDDTVVVNREGMDSSETTAFDQLVGASGIDLVDYEVTEGTIWGSAEKLQGSFKFKRKPHDFDFSQIKLPPLPPLPYPRGGEEMVGIISIYDAHLQKHIGDESDTRQALMSIVEQLIEQAEPYVNRIQRIILPWGNDLSNTDNSGSTTTAGTPQQNRADWRTGIDEVVALSLWVVRVLRQWWPVEVLMVPGNHDRYSTHWLGHVLESAFADDPHVSVDNNHEEWKFTEGLRNGFMFVHGDTTKPKDYASAFAVINPYLFARSRNRTVFSGHLHTEMSLPIVVNEQMGVLVRYMPALTGADQWHKARLWGLNNRGGMLSLYTEQGRFADFAAVVPR